MVLDIDNSIGNGYGTISLINLNGETDKVKLANNNFVKVFFNNK